jgi:flavin reductase (DIM6/NTAB) family NADH-FMN oxidoreductase RutF
MNVAAAELTPAQRYKLLVALVVPRPIAWISSLSASGSVNLAPFSFFNVFCEDPPLIMVGINRRPDGRMKDTIANIERDKEWVVNIADEPLAETMHMTSGDYPPEMSEAEVHGLAMAPSVQVKPPRVKDAPFSLECRMWKLIEVSDDRRLVIGEGVHLHVRDDLFDPATFRIRDDKFFPIGRMFGDRYVRTRDRVQFPPAKGSPTEKGR